MTLSRRQFISSALALAASPFVAQAATPSAGGAGGKVQRLDYTGADDPAVFQKFMERQSLDSVAVAVFHAKWCGPCKMLFGQLDEIAADPAQSFKIIGVDVGPPAFTTGPYQNLVRAFNVRGTPTLDYYADGNKQVQTVGMFQNPADVARYLKALQASVKGTGPARVQAPRP